MITNVWAVLCDQEVPVTAHSEARCDQEPPSPPRPHPRPHDKLWEQRLRTKGPASPGCTKQVKFTVFAHVNCDPLKLLMEDRNCLDLTDENACVCCRNVSMVCPGANHMVCPAALATPMVLLTRVVAPKVCPQMTTTTGPKHLFVSDSFLINVLQFDENNHIGNNCSLDSRTLPLPGRPQSISSWPRTSPSRRQGIAV